MILDNLQHPRAGAGIGLRPIIALAPFCSLLLMLGLAVLATGCGRPPAGNKEEQGQSIAKGDPWEAAAKRLRKDTDLIACKNVLTSLNHELVSGEKFDKPTALSPQGEGSLAALVPLQANDLQEIRPAAFSTHDPVYVSDCLFLRDAARSLALPGLSPVQLADLGFAWVCRQVYLNPMLVNTGSRIAAAAMPPAYILRRGNGSASNACMCSWPSFSRWVSMGV